MGKTESLTPRGLFRRFSSRRSTAEHVPTPASRPAVMAPPQVQSTSDRQVLRQQVLPKEETQPNARMAPTQLAKPLSMADRAEDFLQNSSTKPSSMVDTEDACEHNRPGLYSLPNVGSVSPMAGDRVQTLDSAERKPVRRRSRAMQQMLKERGLASPSPEPDKHLVPTRVSEIVLPMDENSGLARKQSLSPAVPDYVAVTTTPYSSKLNRRKALLIGIGYRNHKFFHALPGCKNDVSMMFDLLTSDLFGFPQRSVKVLSDELETIGTVQVEAPTRSNILRDMQWLTEDVKEGDSVVFFFAGHGDFIEDVSGDEVETGVDQCIMPVDFFPEPKYDTNQIFKGVPPILDDTIYERLVRGVPSGAKVTAIVDACRSGSVCDLPVMHLEDGVRYRPGGSNPPRERRSPHKAAGGFVLFSGSADHQMSVDMTVPKSGEGGGSESFGVMTKSFVDAAMEMTMYRCPETYAGVEAWTYGQLFERVKELVRTRAMRILPIYFEIQEPQMSTSHEFNIWSTPFTI